MKKAEEAKAEAEAKRKAKEEAEAEAKHMLEPILRLAWRPSATHDIV